MTGQPCPGEGLEEGGAHRGQAGVAATPERGVGRQGQQQWQLGAEAVGRSHGELGDRHAHVHVQGEGGLAASKRPQAVLEHLIARAAGHLGFLTHRQRMGPGGGRGQAERPQLLGERRPERRQLGHGAGHGGVHSGLELERAGVRPALTFSARPGESSGRSSSITWARRQLRGSSSITSSSIPTVHAGRAGSARQTAQSGRAAGIRPPAPAVPNALRQQTPGPRRAPAASGA